MNTEKEKENVTVTVTLDELKNLGYRGLSSCVGVYLGLLSKVQQNSSEPYVEVSFKWLAEQCNRDSAGDLYEYLNDLQRGGFIHHYKVWKDDGEYVRVYSMLGWKK